MSEPQQSKVKNPTQENGIRKKRDWGKRKFKIVFLTPFDSASTLVLPDDIVNDSTTGSGRGTAFTRGQRYVSLARLEKGPKTTSELV